MAIETELKLTLDPAQRHRISGLAVVRRLAQGRARRRRLYSIYYDTPEQELFRRKCVLRLRRSGRRYIQAVKTAGRSSGGLHRRDEFEKTVSRPTLDLAHLRRLPILKGIELEDRLLPQFETDFYRTTWDLVFPDGTEVEMAVDYGEARTDGASQPICELELELKRGLPDRLYELALDLARHLDLRLENVSKADRGRALISPRAIVPVNAAEVKLSRADLTEDAFTAILWDCFEQIRANEEPVLLTDDLEAVHQMRIGLRRLRSCLNTFGGVISRGLKPPFLGNINRLSRLLGACRDWDVFVTHHLHAMLAQVEPDHAVHKLTAAAEVEREASYARLRPFVRSREYNLLMVELAAFIALRQWRATLEPEAVVKMQRPIMGTVKEILSRNHKRITKRAEGVEQQQVPVLHRLRIECKKQRYAVEFFESILPRKTARRYRNTLRDLQDILGYLNDSVVADLLLAQLSLKGEAAGAKAFVSGWAARARADHLEDDLPGAWAAFLKQKRFWRKLKA